MLSSTSKLEARTTRVDSWAPYFTGPTYGDGFDFDISSNRPLTFEM